MNHKTKKIVIMLTIIILFLLISSMVFGTKIINPFTANLSETDYQIIYNLRLPRTLAALFSGMTLAASGLLIQTSMRNSLADSSILGFQSGATLVAMFIMLAMPSLYSFLPLFAFLGGLVVYAIIYTIAIRNESALFLVVAGIAISSIIRSFVNLLSQMFAEDLDMTIAWLNGSLNTVNRQDMLLIVLYSVILLLITMKIAPKLDILLMDDDYLINLGVKVSKVRFITTALAILLTAVSVSFVGTIGFVGLLAPHISRKLVNQTSTNLMPTTILIGGVLVLGCDLLQRVLFPIYEIPVGTIMSLVGGIYLLYLLIRSNNVRV
ncbi:iron ABC transporter permease [Mollicutes bacterium LVI A0039]|nr:iron ABC transporter permease [Mollicutes bacterium LVI A0039]